MDDEKENNKYPKVPEKYRIEYIGYPKKQDRRKRYINIGQFFSNHWKKALFITIVFLVIWSIISDSGVETREFPQLAEPKTVTFEWEYKGSKYFMSETLYKTVYDYYNSSPEKHCWTREENFGACLKIFLEEAEEDNTISKIASDIKVVASKNGLRGDELLELTVAFVQSIPYDEDKLELVTYSNKPEDLYPRYPYEVLYDNEGICTGKSFLAASLIKELGYGVALFDYEAVTEDEVGHIAPAVKCPTEYSSYSSGYCYAEVTDLGFKIGEIPQMDINTKMPRIRTPISLFKEKEIKPSRIELGNAEICIITDGDDDSYQGIIKTVQTIQRIQTLEKEVSRLYRIISSLDEEANQLENSVKYYEQQSESAYRRHLILGDYASYNEYSKLYSQYKSAYAKYESKLNEYNRKIDQYNNFVYEYNTLIEDFYK